MTTFPNGPELWHRVIDDLTPLFGSGIVAGGCVRDWFLGYAPKDIDLFTSAQPAFPLPPEIVKQPYNAADEYARADLGAFDVYETTHLEHVINIIVCHVPPGAGDELIATFDWGLTKCFYNYARREASLHEDCCSDLNLRRCTLIHDHGQEQSAKRFNRWKARTGAPHIAHIRYVMGDTIFQTEDYGL